MSDTAAKCPAIRSFPRFLALREMRRRLRTYLPMFCIYFGVMLLLFNLFIYTESRIQSDILYYKVNTQWILPELTDAEISCHLAADAAASRGQYSILLTVEFVRMRMALLRAELVFAVVDRQLCQKRAFPPGPDGQILLQQLAEYRLHRVLRIMRRAQISERHAIDAVGIRIKERQHLGSFHFSGSPFL